MKISPLKNQLRAYIYGIGNWGHYQINQPNNTLPFDTGRINVMASPNVTLALTGTS